MKKSTKPCPRCRRRLKMREFRFAPELTNAYTKMCAKTKYCQDCQRAIHKEKSGRIGYGMYKIRDGILKTMGFDSYGDYLKSQKWKRIRMRVMEKQNFTCQSCGERATQVHHNYYRIQELSGQSLRAMTALCNDCHKAIEFDGNRKVPFIEATHRCRNTISLRENSESPRRSVKDVAVV